MYIDDVFDLLQEIEDKSLYLSRKGLINTSTRNFFFKGSRDIKNEIKRHKRSKIGEKIVLENIVYQMLLYKDILILIEKGITGEKFYIELLKEVIEKFNNFTDIDIFLLSLGPENYPFCYLNSYNKELTFILILPGNINYLSKKLGGLLTHETSHLHPIINRYIYSIRSEKQKVGESLADLLGLILAGPVFSYSMGYLVKNIIGLPNSTIPTSQTHPSWAVRAGILYYLNKSIWTLDTTMKKIESYLNELSSIFTQVSVAEERLLGKCIREGENYMNEFIRFKIDENILSSIKALDKSELEKMEKIIQLNVGVSK